jgi:hypothetical protein
MNRVHFYTKYTFVCYTHKLPLDRRLKAQVRKYKIKNLIPTNCLEQQSVFKFKHALTTERVALNREHLLEHHPALAILRKAIIKEARLQLLAGCLLLLCGGGLVSFAFSRSTLLTIVGMALLLWSIQILWTVQLNPDKSKIMGLLYYHPRQIVWVYTIVTQRMPFGFHFTDAGLLYFKLLDGDEVSISLPTHQLKLLSRTLNRVLPHALFGYSDDRETLYNTDPKMLRVDENQSDNNEETGKNS